MEGHLILCLQSLLPQAREKIELMMSTLKEELGLSLSRIRVEYFGVPKHRDIFQQILADKVNGGGLHYPYSRKLPVNVNDKRCFLVKTVSSGCNPHNISHTRNTYWVGAMPITFHILETLIGVGAMLITFHILETLIGVVAMTITFHLLENPFWYIKKAFRRRKSWNTLFPRPLQDMTLSCRLTVNNSYKEYSVWNVYYI